MKLTDQIKLEEAAMFAASFILFYWGGNFLWWIYPVFLLAPDISMLGYLVNNKTGAFTYNLFHNKAIALAVEIAGLYFLNNYLIMAGLILFGHSSMDRMLGYGLKYNDAFKHTHLGWIGKKETEEIV